MPLPFIHGLKGSFEKQTHLSPLCALINTGWSLLKRTSRQKAFTSSTDQEAAFVRQKDLNFSWISDQPDRDPILLLAHLGETDYSRV